MKSDLERRPEPCLAWPFTIARCHLGCRGKSIPAQVCDSFHSHGGRSDCSLSSHESPQMTRSGSLSSSCVAGGYIPLLLRSDLRMTENLRRLFAPRAWWPGLVYDDGAAFLAHRSFSFPLFNCAIRSCRFLRLISAVALVITVQALLLLCHLQTSALAHQRVPPCWRRLSDDCVDALAPSVVPFRGMICFSFPLCLSFFAAATALHLVETLVLRQAMSGHSFAHRGDAPKNLWALDRRAAPFWGCAGVDLSALALREVQRQRLAADPVAMRAASRSPVASGSLFSETFSIFGARPLSACRTLRERLTFVRFVLGGAEVPVIDRILRLPLAIRHFNRTGWWRSRPGRAGSSAANRGSGRRRRSPGSRLSAPPVPAGWPGIGAR